MLNILAWLFCAFDKADDDTIRCRHETLAEKRPAACSNLVLDLPDQQSHDQRKNSHKEKVIETIEEYLMEKSWEAVNSDCASTVLLSSSDSADESRRVPIDEDDFITEVNANDMQAVVFGDDLVDGSHVSSHSPPVSSTPMSDHVKSNLSVEHNGMNSSSPAVSLSYNDIAQPTNNTLENEETDAEQSDKVYKSSMYVRSVSPRPTERGRMEVQIKAKSESNDVSDAPSALLDHTDETGRPRSDSWEKLDASMGSNDIGTTKISIHVGGTPVNGRMVVLEPSPRGRVHVTEIEKPPTVVKITHTAVSANGKASPIKHVDTFETHE